MAKTAPSAREKPASAKSRFNSLQPFVLIRLIVGSLFAIGDGLRG